MTRVTKVQSDSMVQALSPVETLDKDIVKRLRAGDAVPMGSSEVRYMVDLYYQMQEQRIINGNRVKGLLRDAAKTGNEPEPHEIIKWAEDQSATMEAQVKRALTAYVACHPLSWFFDQTTGIGPVIAAGLLAHIDISKCPTVGHIWSFAGLDPNKKWEKGQKRPWNAALKVLCWKAGESFVKQQSNKNDIYGKVYAQRKEYEWEKNLNGELAEQAKQTLEERRFGADTDAILWYSGKICPVKVRAALAAGKLVAKDCLAEDGNGLPMLPPSRLHLRASRYAVKLFLSHLHHRWYEMEFGKEPPKPYIIEHGGHVHFIAPPQTKPGSDRAKAA